MTVQITIELLSDCCLSSGASGRIGEVDADQEYQPDTGLPILRGRTLKGLLVDEVSGLLQALSAERQGATRTLAERLFGGADPGLLHFSDGQLDPALVRSMRGEAKRLSAVRIRNALSVVRVQTRVDSIRGAPVRGSLRSTRLLRAGLVFYMPVVPCRPLCREEVALLALAVQTLRRLGLHRTRGWGRVKAELWVDGQPQTGSWQEHLTALRMPAATPAVGAASAPPPTAPGVETLLTYRLRLQAPLVVATASGDASTVETLRYLAGSTILGALATRYLSRWPSPDPTADDRFYHLFLSGEVRWLNAYPVARDRNRRLCPAPLSLEAKKGEESPKTVFDRASGTSPPAEYRRLPSTFAAFTRDDEDTGAAELLHRQPMQSLRLHHTRGHDRAPGEDGKEDGTLYSVNSLRADEVLAGHVLCPDPATAALVRELLQGGPLFLGRSRSASYGGLAAVEAMQEEPGTRFCEAGTDEPDEGDPLVVTLLSDYLGRTPEGAADGEALLTDLRDALGQPASWKPKQRFLKSRLVAGYVGVWRMPRPLHLSVAAGSVLCFPATELDAERVRRLLWHGLGERRAEGFGRVALNWHGEQEEFKARPAEVPEQAAPAAPRPAYWQEALLEDRLGEHLAHRAFKDAAAIGPLPSSSLLARIRDGVRNAAGPAAVRALLRDMRDKEAGKALDRCRRGRQPFQSFLKDLLESDDGGRWIDLLEITQILREEGLERAALKDRSWRFLQRYLDALFEALRRRAQQQRDGQGDQGRSTR